MKREALSSETQRVVQADEALVNYLDTLLSEIDADDIASKEISIKGAPVQADTLQQRAAEIERHGDAASLAVNSSESRVVQAPAWAENPFQVLLFTVNGVNLAAPLSTLCGILSLDAPISRLPGQPAWAMGVVLNREDKVVVVDTRRLLMPAFEARQDEAVWHSHLLLIGHGERGLAVESLKDMVMLEKEAVRWRSGAGQHPWYAGIIVEKLTVLLDVDGLMEMLAVHGASSLRNEKGT
jgi:purine-binding chemotaxis protein CheW